MACSCFSTLASSLAMSASMSTLVSPAESFRSMMRAWSSATGFSNSRNVTMGPRLVVFFGVRKRMGAVHQLDEPRRLHVRVDLRGGDVGVAQHRLQRPKVGAAFEQVRGKGVAKDMRADPRRGDPGLGPERLRSEE